MSDVSVIGLGNMGSALARTLLNSGRSVTVWNRSPEKAPPLAEAGAEIAPSLEAAVAASEVIIVCIKTHKTTTETLTPVKAALKDKTVADLSTGGVGEAEELVTMLTEAGANWTIGMINAYPSGIGKEETAILCAGPQEAWARIGGMIGTLGGASEHVGTAPAAIPALFAAMFTARQGFMFGLLYGGAIARRSGLDMQVFADQIGVTHGMAGNYGNLFARTVVPQDYDNAEASMTVYKLALEDVLSTFEETGTRDDFVRLMRDLTADAESRGLENKQLTALVEELARD